MNNLYLAIWILLLFLLLIISLIATVKGILSIEFRHEETEEWSLEKAKRIRLQGIVGIIATFILYGITMLFFKPF